MDIRLVERHVPANISATGWQPDSNPATD